jgi:DNA-binding Lrp family transcriptional regulator
MDKLDRQMLLLLERNPRITYRQLAEQLHLSITSIQRRLSNLVSTNKIRGFRTFVNLEAMGGIRTIVFGQMIGKLEDDMISHIERQGSIHTMSCGSLNNLYLFAHLHRISDLDAIIEIAQNVCGISNPQVIIFGSGSVMATCPSNLDSSKIGDASALNAMDYKIISSLHYDARKPIADVANEVGLSPRTVRKRLSNMIASNLIEFRTISSIEGSDVLDFTVLVKLKTSESRPMMLRKIREDPLFHVSSSIVVSNAPDKLFLEVETESVNEIGQIVQDLRDRKEVESVSSDLLQKVYYFDTWRDWILKDGKHETKNKRIEGMYNH